MNDNEMREVLRQLLTDWNNMTAEQQSEALAAVAPRAVFNVGDPLVSELVRFWHTRDHGKFLDEAAVDWLNSHALRRA